MSYESYLEREQLKHQSLNSGFAAFEKWDAKLSFRSNLREILEGVKTRDDLPSLENKLRKLEWGCTETCLVWGCENSYDPDEVCIDKLEGRDRLVADLVSGTKEYGYDGGSKFFVTLLVFTRVVAGTRTSTKIPSKRNRNDEEIFVGYNTFSEIEYDDIDICKWAPLDTGSPSGYSGFLKEEDKDMFVGGIFNKGGLREMFVGREPHESASESCTFYRTALVMCPTENIIKLNEAGSIHFANRTFWVLRSGSLVASHDMKIKISHHVMKHFRERTAQERLVENNFIKCQLQQALDILMDAVDKCSFKSDLFSMILEFISTLSSAVRDWPHNESEFSDTITDALIRLQSTLDDHKYLRLSKDREPFSRLAKERFKHLSNATQNGRPILTHCQNEATFDENAKFSEKVQTFLRGHLEEEEFGPFSDNDEAEKWTHAHFGWIHGRWSQHSLEGRRAERIGKYCATGTIKDNGTSVHVKKNSESVHQEKVELYELQVAALDELERELGLE